MPDRKVFCCDTCPKTFTRPWTLKRHKRDSCQQAKPKPIHQCPYCKEWFTRLHSVKRHFKVCTQKPELEGERVELTLHCRIC